MEFYKFMDIDKDKKFLLSDLRKNHQISNKTTNKIFEIRKYNRKGLFEKKMMKKNDKLNYGKWTDEENAKFISTSLKYGASWFKVANN